MCVWSQGSTLAQWMVSKQKSEHTDLMRLHYTIHSFPDTDLHGPLLSTWWEKVDQQ